MPKFEDYLGDGLYVSFDGYQFCLMANSHTQPTDMVYLDPQVLEAFNRFVARVKAAQNEPEVGLSGKEAKQFISDIL